MVEAVVEPPVIELESAKPNRNKSNELHRTSRPRGAHRRGRWAPSVHMYGCRDRYLNISIEGREPKKRINRNATLNIIPFRGKHARAPCANATREMLRSGQTPPSCPCSGKHCVQPPPETPSCIQGIQRGFQVFLHSEKEGNIPRCTSQSKLKIFRGVICKFAPMCPCSATRKHVKNRHAWEIKKLTPSQEACVATLKICTNRRKSPDKPHTHPPWRWGHECIVRFRGKINVHTTPPPDAMRNNMVAQTAKGNHVTYKNTNEVDAWVAGNHQDKATSTVYAA